MIQKEHFPFELYTNLVLANTEGTCVFVIYSKTFQAFQGINETFYLRLQLHEGVPDLSFPLYAEKGLQSGRQFG